MRYPIKPIIASCALLSIVACGGSSQTSPQPNSAAPTNSTNSTNNTGNTTNTGGTTNTPSQLDSPKDVAELAKIIVIRGYLEFQLEAGLLGQGFSTAFPAQDGTEVRPCDQSGNVTTTRMNVTRTEQHNDCVNGDANSRSESTGSSTVVCSTLENNNCSEGRAQIDSYARNGNFDDNGQQVASEDISDGDINFDYRTLGLDLVTGDLAITRGFSREGQFTISAFWNWQMLNYRSDRQPMGTGNNPISMNSDLNFTTSGFRNCPASGELTVTTTTPVDFDINGIALTGEVRFSSADGGQADITFSDGAMTVSIGGQQTFFSAMEVEQMCEP